MLLRRAAAGPGLLIDELMIMIIITDWMRLTCRMCWADNWHKFQWPLITVAGPDNFVQSFCQIWSAGMRDLCCCEAGSAELQMDRPIVGLLSTPSVKYESRQSGPIVLAFGRWTGARGENCKYLFRLQFDSGNYNVLWFISKYFPSPLSVKYNETRGYEWKAFLPQSKSKRYSRTVKMRR